MNTNRAAFILSGYRWIITGIVSGLIFYLFFGTVIPQLFDEPIIERGISFGVLYWSLFGIGFIGLTKAGVKIGYRGKRWIIQGLLWGFGMFAMLLLAVPYFESGEIPLKSVLFGLPFWSLSGLGYGYVMKLYYNEYGLPSESTE